MDLHIIIMVPPRHRHREQTYGRGGGGAPGRCCGEKGRSGKHGESHGNIHYHI